MKWRKKILWRALLITVVMVVAAGAIAPFVRADRFGVRIREALEEALQRKVEIAGPVRLKLLGGPGFSVEDVIIHDDPAMGLEPFAYVTSLEAGLRLSSIWRRRLEFSSLRLVEPSVNLVKNKAGSWNYLPLLQRAFWPSQLSSAAPPAIQVRSGRLNVKFGDTKSIFYLSNADVDVSPSRDEVNTLRMRFAGELARTDQSVRAFGVFSGGGSLILTKGEEPRVELNVRLQRSAISEVLVLLRGSGMGAEGFVASEARLEGPVSDIQITGKLQLAEITRWQLLPSSGEERSLNYQGRLNLEEQIITLDTAASEESSLPVAFRFRAEDYLGQPRWEISVALENMPLESMPELARDIGVDIPDLVEARGVVTGALNWTSAGLPQGHVTIRNGEVDIAGAPLLRYEETDVLVSDGQINLAPTDIAFEDGQHARVEIQYQPNARKLEVRLSSEELAISRLQALWPQLVDSPVAPPLDSLHSGTLRGSLRYIRETDNDGTWTADIELHNTVAAIEGLADPLEIASSSVKLKGREFEMKDLSGRIGKVSLSGDYSFSVDSEPPHRFELLVARLDVIQLERLLLPTLRSRPQGFIARTLGLKPVPPPEWLKARRITGVLQVGEFKAGAVTLDSLSTTIHWNGTSAELADLKSGLDGASLQGRISVDLQRELPAYLAEASIKELKWEGGTVDAEGKLTATGIGVELLRQTSAKGSFEGRSIKAGLDSEWSSVSGGYQLSMVNGLPILRFESVELTRGAEKLHGDGETSLTGKLDVRFSSESEEFQMTGTLIPLRVEMKKVSQVR